MSRVQRALAVRRRALRDGRRGEGGFALIATIVVIGLTSVIVLGLLSLSYASTAYSGAQVQRDRATRAADSALENALNVLGREALTLGSASDTEPCMLVDDQTVGGRQLPTTDVDGLKVVVTCVPQSPDAPPVPIDGTTESVKVVGTRYNGDVPRAVNLDRLPCDPADPATAAFCWPWTKALGGAASGQAKAYASGIDPANAASVVAVGPGPLSFSSDVTVREGAAAVRNPVCDPEKVPAGDVCGEDQFGPAVAVAGQYRQGDNGLGDNPGTSDPDTRDCGVQSRFGAPKVESVWIRTLRLDPLCNSAEARTLSAGSSGFERPRIWTQTETESAGANLPACSGSVITLVPGVYGPTQTRTLNSWFRKTGQGGTCDGKVFWFRAGDYYFDVGDTDPASASAPNSLTFDDPSSVVVFGNPVPGTWDPDTDGVAKVATLFPDGVAPNREAEVIRPCRPGGSTGVSLTLSSRTTLRHQRGRVAVCDQRTATQPATAVWQTPVRTAPYGPATPGGVASLSPLDGNQVMVNLGAGSLQSQDGNAATAEPPCGYNSIWQFVFALIANVTWCSQFNTGFTVFSWTIPLPAINSPAPIDSLKLNLVGSSSKLQFAGAAVDIQVFGGQLGAVGCRVAANSASQVTQSINLLSGSCAEPLSDLRRLSGASLRVTFKRLQVNCRDIRVFGYVVNSGLCSGNDRPRISVDSASIEARLSQDKGATSKPFLFTSNIAKPGEYGDSFNLWGRLSAPLSDVDLRWNGTPTPEPVVNGSMVVNGIGSVAAADRVGNAYVARPGVVCCTIADQSERALAVNAWTELAPKSVPTRAELVRVTGRVDGSGNPVFVDRLGDELVCPAPGSTNCGALASDADLAARLRYLSGDRVGTVAGSPALVEADGTTPVLAGRLTATARVAMVDWINDLPGPTSKAGHSARVDSWQLCATPPRRFSLTATPGVGVLDCESY